MRSSVLRKGGSCVHVCIGSKVLEGEIIGCCQEYGGWVGLQMGRVGDELAWGDGGGEFLLLLKYTNYMCLLFQGMKTFGASMQNLSSV